MWGNNFLPIEHMRNTQSKKDPSVVLFRLVPLVLLVQRLGQLPLLVHWLGRVMSSVKRLDHLFLLSVQRWGILLSGIRLDYLLSVYRLGWLLPVHMLGRLLPVHLLLLR